MKFTSIQPNYFDEEHGIALFEGDSVEVLKALREELADTVDAVISDPPYGISYASNYRIYDDLLAKPIHNDTNLEVVDVVASLLQPLLKNNSALYFFGHASKIGETRKIFDPLWTYKNTIIWDKGDSGTAGDLKAGYCLNFECILYYNKGRRVLNGARPRAIFRYESDYHTHRDVATVSSAEYLAYIEYLLHMIPEDSREEVHSKLPDDIISAAMREYPKAKIRQDWSSNNDPVHPTVKPQYLMERLIKNSTDPGDLVIDPFMGSSPVGAACKKLGRRFIGIELAPEFFRIAQTRIAKTKKL